MKSRLTNLVIVAVSFLIVGLVLGMMTDDWNENEKVVGYDYHYSDEKVMSRAEALYWIEDVAIYSHDYYIKNPELQNKGTGDTAYNLKAIKQYNRLRELIKRLDN